MKYTVKGINSGYQYECERECFVSEIFKKQGHLAQKDFYVVCNGKILPLSTVIEDGSIYHIVPRLVGGKGGFGSMLRALGAQIEKTTNREACRDLSGRRMRDVNNEKKIKEWVGKAKDREREREEKRRERLERRKAVPLHKFEDPTYEKQKSQVIENLDDALRQGLKRTANGTASSAEKRPIPSSTSTTTKKAKTEWLGIDMDDFDSDSDDSGSEESESRVQASTSSSPSNSSPDEETGDVTSTTIEDNTSASLSHTPEKKTASDVKSIEPAIPQDVNGTNKQINEEITSSMPAHTAVPEDGAIDLNSYSAATELEALGLDCLKAALISRGLKCGGTLQERAQRLFSVKGLTHDEIDPSLKSKSMKGKNVKGK